MNKLCQKRRLLVLPYLGKLSLEFRKRLVNILSNIPCCKLQFIFRSKRRLRTIFHFKDTQQLMLHSHLVYRYRCKGCNTLYYGKTDLHFQARACKHMGIRLVETTVISDHALISEHHPDLESFSILSKERSRSSLIREGLFIFRVNRHLIRLYVLTHYIFFNN